jgi:voltage-gated potassium channel
MKHFLDSARLRGSLTFIIALFIVCVVVGVVFYHYVEGFTAIDAIYFTIMTLTTVGYGDITPHTDIGKLFTAVYALTGIGVFLGLAAALFAATLERFGVRQSDDQK